MFGKSLLTLALFATLLPFAGAQSRDIVQTAIDAGQFKTLVTAVGAAGLADTLKGPGPFTVLAPTDDAFKKLPAGTVEKLLTPGAKADLSAILLGHVVSGVAKAADVAKLDFVETLNKDAFRVMVGEGGVTIGGAKVTTTDIVCSNGVIHVIDTVLLPQPTIKDLAAKAGTFQTLLAAAEAAGLVPALTGNDALTVFAPTDEAFAKLPKGTVETLLKPENREKLARIIKFHVVAGRTLAKDVVKMESVKTLAEKSATITVKEHTVMIEGAKIVKTDLTAKNGVVHVIDAVILP